MIIICQSNICDSHPFIYKKYSSDRYGMAAKGAIPNIESLTALLVKKTDQKETVPNIIGFCEYPFQDMKDENN